jgi:DNA-binding transcriptional LysR family regulator
VIGNEAWRLADLGAKHALLLAGNGWGFMPEPTVHADLVAARLARLDLPETQ